MVGAPCNNWMHEVEIDYGLARAVRRTSNAIIFLKNKENCTSAFLVLGLGEERRLSRLDPMLFFARWTWGVEVATICVFAER